MSARICASGSGPVPDLLRAGLVRAVSAAVDAAVLLRPVADDAAAAVGALRRERLDGALEAVERVRGASHRDLERLVVLVSADFTACCGHDAPRPKSCGAGRGSHQSGCLRSCQIPSGAARHRKFISASIVPRGFSSMSQCPVFSRTIAVTSTATVFVCCARALPFAFAPPMERTGIVSLVRDSSSKSFAVRGNETKYAHPARI